MNIAKSIILPDDICILASIYYSSRNVLWWVVLTLEIDACSHSSHPTLNQTTVLGTCNLALTWTTLFPDGV